MEIDWSKIEPHHVEWIFNAALKDFAEQLADHERELIRHRAFTGTEAYHRYGREDRNEKITELERRADELRKLCAFVTETKAIVQAAHMAADAKELVQSIAGRAPKKKATAKRAKG